MIDKSYQEVIAEIGPLPGLSDWCQRGALALRTGDITNRDFQDKLRALIDRIETMYDEAQPENMEPETYQIAKEYYDSLSSSLDYYLEGMELLLDWSTKGTNTTLNQAKVAFQEGDRITQETTVLAFKLHEEFQELDEALIKHLQATSGGNAP